MGLGPAAVVLLHLQGLPVQVVGGEIGTEVRSVAVDRAILHQAIGQEQLLAKEDVLAGEDGLLRLGNHSARDRGVVLVHAQRQVAQHREPEDEREDHPLEPERRNHHRSPLLACHRNPSYAGYSFKIACR